MGEGGGVGFWGGGGGGQGGCEWRSEAFVKIQKRNLGGGGRVGGGVRVDVNGEVKLFVKVFVFCCVCGGGGGGGRAGGGGWGGVRVDGNGEVKLL